MTTASWPRRACPCQPPRASLSLVSASSAQVADEFSQSQPPQSSQYRQGSLHPLAHSCTANQPAFPFTKSVCIQFQENIEKLGKAGKTVKVAPGHFRNHLMPKLLAVPNIDKFAHLIKEQRKIYQREEEEEVKVVKETVEDKMKEYETAAKRLTNAKLTIRASINTEKFRARATKDEAIEFVHQ